MRDWVPSNMIFMKSMAEKTAQERESKIGRELGEGEYKNHTKMQIAPLSGLQLHK